MENDEYLLEKDCSTSVLREDTTAGMRNRRKLSNNIPRYAKFVSNKFNMKLQYEWHDPLHHQIATKCPSSGK